MSIFKQTVTNGGGGEGFELPPDGNLTAVCVALIDLGTTMESYGGKPPKECRKIYIAWELVGSPKEDGKNFVVCNSYNVYFNDKATLRKVIESWRGKAFAEGEEVDLLKVLGAPCLLQITHEKSGKGNDVYKIKAVTSLPKGMPVPTATYPKVQYAIGEGEIPTHDWLPFIFGEKVADKIAKSMEMTGKKPGGQTAPASKPQAPAEDTVPF